MYVCGYYSQNCIYVFLKTIYCLLYIVFCCPNVVSICRAPYTALYEQYSNAYTKRLLFF